MKTIILSLALLAITEAILKPILTRFVQIGIKAYIPSAFDRLDELLAIPENWQKFVDDAEEFIYDSVLPNQLEEDVAEQLTDYLINYFDMATFLTKTEVGKHVHQLELNI